MVISYRRVTSGVLPQEKRMVRSLWERKGLWSDGVNATGCPGFFSCLPLASQGRRRQGGLADDSALQESPAIKLGTVSGSLGTWDRLLAQHSGSALSVSSGTCASPIRKAEMVPSVAPQQYLTQNSFLGKNREAD